MLKRILVLTALISLVGCGDSEKPQETAQDDFSAFMEYHNKACRCILDNMPNVKRVLQKESANAENLFCLWTAFMCANSKSPDTLKQSVQIITNLGKFSCDKLGEITNAAQEQNVNALCAEQWAPESVDFTRKVVHLTNLCDNVYGAYADCICVVRHYVSDLSNEELAALAAYGQLFPGYGWKVANASMRDLTTSIMTKMRNAVSACPK